MEKEKEEEEEEEEEDEGGKEEEVDTCCENICMTRDEEQSEGIEKTHDSLTFAVLRYGNRNTSITQRYQGFPKKPKVRGRSKQRTMATARGSERRSNTECQ
jgi:hypothetical protein